MGDQGFIPEWGFRLIIFSFQRTGHDPVISTLREVPQACRRDRLTATAVGSRWGRYGLHARAWFCLDKVLLTLFVGLVLVDFPRKRVLVRRVLGNNRVLRSINRLRGRFGKPELMPPPPQTVNGKPSPRECCHCHRMRILS
jgi:hypothetical protein